MVKVEEAVYVELVRCTGCGACAKACPREAIALVDGKAVIDHKACSGCLACVDACPEEAIQPVVEGELVRVPERPAPTAYRPRPLAPSVAAGIAVAGVAVVARLVRALARTLTHWAAQPRIDGGEPDSGGSPAAHQSFGRGGRGQQARHRHRGG